MLRNGITRGSVPHMVDDGPTGPIKVDAAALDFARRAAGWTQRELADRAGVSTGHISRIIRGEGGIGVAGMAGILRAFGNRLSLDELCVMQQAPSDVSDGAC